MNTIELPLDQLPPEMRDMIAREAGGYTQRELETTRKQMADLEDAFWAGKMTDLIAKHGGSDAAKILGSARKLSEKLLKHEHNEQWENCVVPLAYEFARLRFEGKKSIREAVETSREASEGEEGIDA